MDTNLSATEVYDILLTKKIDTLYHANTVATAKSFVTKSGIMSRALVESLGLQQTKQKTDLLDKNFGIYNDVFLDGADLADAFKQPNVYGPVLFKYKLTLLLDEGIQTVKIPKVNPYYWHAKLSDEQRYYTSLSEFQKNYKNGRTYNDAHSSLMLTTIDGFLPFEKGLFEILVDDPQMTHLGTPIIDLVIQHLFPATGQFRSNFTNVEIIPMKRFRGYYKNMSQHEFIKMFKRTIPSDSPLSSLT